MTDETFKNLLHDLALELIEKTKDPSIYEPDDQYNSGYRAALYSVLHLVEEQAASWELDRAAIGLESFSADDWQQAGIRYWKEARGD